MIAECHPHVLGLRDTQTVEVSTRLERYSIDMQIFILLYTSVIRIFSSGFRARAASFSSGTAGSPPNSHTTYTTASSFGLCATGSTPSHVLRLSFFSSLLFSSLSRLQLSAFYNRHISHTFLDAGAAEFLAHRIHDPHAALGPAPSTGLETGASATSPLAEPPPRPKPIVKRVLNYAALDPLHLPFPLLSSSARTGCTAVPN